MASSNCHPQNNMDCYYNGKWKEKYIEKNLGKNIISYFSISQSEINEKLIKLIKNNKYIKEFKKSYKNKNIHNSYIFERINNICKIDDHKSFTQVLVSLAMVGTNIFGEIYVKSHHINPKNYIINLDEVDLTIGNIDNYEKNDNGNKSIAKLRDGLYLLHPIIESYGYNLRKIKDFVSNIIVFELMLSEHMRSFIDSTDPLKTSHSMKKAEFMEKYKCNLYKILFKDIPDESYINLPNPAFIEFIVKLFNNFDKFSDMLVDYIAYKYFINISQYLEIDNIISQIIPHYEIKDRSFQTISNYLGSFIEDEYEKTIDMQNRITDIENIFETIRNYCIKQFSKNNIFTQNTNNEAIKKLLNMEIIIGKSNSIYNLSDFPNLTDNFFENIDKINNYYFTKMIKLIGKPVDRSLININNDVYSFYLNAYYDQSLNVIYLPTSTCTNYFYNPESDPIYNYGSIGTIIGHEIMHSFDNNGASYDSDGILRNWWTESDYEKFNIEVEKIKNHYSKISVGDINIDGSISVSENFADIIGIKVSLRAYISKYMENNVDYDKLKIFFSQWTNSFKSVTKKDYFEHLVKNDVHAPGIVRVNAPFSHIIEYYNTYDVKPHHKNYLEKSNRTIFLGE